MARVERLQSAPRPGAERNATEARSSVRDPLWHRLAEAEAALGANPTPWAIGAYATAVQAVLATALRQRRPFTRIAAARAALAEAVEALRRETPAWEWMRACDRLRGLLIDLWW